MRSANPLASVLFLCVMAFACLWSRSTQAADLTGVELPLFNGETLDGWKVEGNAQIAVQDGMLHLQSGNGWLRSEHQYSDFILYVEWKAMQSETYDSGIYIRAPSGAGPYPKGGHQINLREGREGNISDIKGAESVGLIKPGQWNAFEIKVTGDRVATAINGQLAYDVSGVRASIGHVGIQVEVPKGGQFLIRKVIMHELGYSSLFDGHTLAGWRGAGQDAATCWKVEDGNLICTGQKGPWLRSAREYGDFNLRFDYQVAPSGNSGVYVRVPESGLHHRSDDTLPQAGFEVQILDDFAPRHAKLKPYQFCGSIYDICGAGGKVGRPAGQWNSLEINCQGQNVRTIHNGVVITEVTPKTHPLIALRQTKGFLGLQNHKTVVKFRHLRVGPPMAR
jgi:hypothetical protein